MLAEGQSGHLIDETMNITLDQYVVGSGGGSGGSI